MRLIDADALIEDIKSFWDWDSIDGITATTVLKQTMTDISNAPTIDAEPVRHGRWEPYEFGDDTWHKCSVCGIADKYIDIVARKGYIDGRPQFLSTRLVSKRNYCPICGATMDGGTQ